MYYVYWLRRLIETSALTLCTYYLCTRSFSRSPTRAESRGRCADGLPVLYALRRRLGSAGTLHRTSDGHKPCGQPYGYPNPLRLFNWITCPTYTSSFRRGSLHVQFGHCPNPIHSTARMELATLAFDPRSSTSITQSRRLPLHALKHGSVMRWYTSRPQHI